MVKHSQKIRRQQTMNCVFGHFVGLAFKGLSEIINFYLPEVIWKPLILNEFNVACVVKMKLFFMG